MGDNREDRDYLGGWLAQARDRCVRVARLRSITSPTDSWLLVEEPIC